MEDLTLKKAKWNSENILIILLTLASWRAVMEGVAYSKEALSPSLLNNLWWLEAHPTTQDLISHREYQRHRIVLITKTRQYNLESLVVWMTSISCALMYHQPCRVSMLSLEKEKWPLLLILYHLKRETTSKKEYLAQKWLKRLGSRASVQLTPLTKECRLMVLRCLAEKRSINLPLKKLMITHLSLNPRSI